MAVELKGSLMDPCVYTTQHDIWLSCRGGLLVDAAGLLPQRQTLEEGTPATDTSCHAAGVVPKARRDDPRFGLPLRRRTRRDSFRRSVRERPRLAWLKDEDRLWLQRDTMIKSQSQFKDWDIDREMDTFMKAITWFSV